MKKLLLYGNSILIASLATSLQCDAGVEIIHAACANPPELHAPQGLDAVIVDLNTASLTTLLALLSDHPGVLLLGLDATTGLLTALSGCSYPVGSVEEVLTWIQNHRPAAFGPAGDRPDREIVPG